VVRHHSKNAVVSDVALNRQTILEGIARLSAEHRAVIRRSYYESWTTAQIANDLHIDEDTVRSRLHHGLLTHLTWGSNGAGHCHTGSR
jgi:RNA polymerase sigma-70 factor (ECF subfamily)